MKKFISILCFVQLGIFSILYAQAYEPLVRENAHWVVADLDDWPVWHNVDFREYSTDGDTLLGGVLYKKVYRFPLEASDFMGSPPYVRTGDPSLYGLLREDTASRIVYGLQVDIEPDNCFYEEDTLFDFSLAQDDTFTLCQTWAAITVDTIYYSDVYGYYRKQFQMAGSYWGILSEGIGSSFGLFEAWGFAFKKDLLGSQLKCYTIGDISNCDILTQTNESHKPDIKMYPNPLEGDYLYARLPMDCQNVTILVSDVYGKPMYQGILASGTNKLNLGGLGKGIYFIKFLKDNKLLLNKKILRI